MPVEATVHNALANCRTKEYRGAAMLLCKRIDAFPAAAAAALLVVLQNHEDGLPGAGFNFYDKDTGPDLALTLQGGGSLKEEKQVLTVIKLARRYASQVMKSVGACDPSSKSSVAAARLRIEALWAGCAADGTPLRLRAPKAEATSDGDGSSSDDDGVGADNDAEEHSEELSRDSSASDDGDDDGYASDGHDSDEDYDEDEDADDEWGTHADEDEDEDAPAPASAGPAMVLASQAARDVLAARHDVLREQWKAASAAAAALKKQLQQVKRQLRAADARVAEDEAARHAADAATLSGGEDEDEEDEEEDDEEELFRRPPARTPAHGCVDCDDEDEPVLFTPRTSARADGSAKRRASSPPADSPAPKTAPGLSRVRRYVFD